MPRGFSKKKELLSLAREMRRTMKLHEISKELDTPISTISQWLSDIDGAKHRARRAKYSGICVKCGKKTCGSYGPDKAPELCNKCIVDHLVNEGRMASNCLRSEIEQCWAEGMSIKQIATEIEWTSRSVGTFIVLMRKEGHDLPYRRKMTQDGLAKLRAQGKSLNYK